MGVAASDVKYNQLASELKSKGEFKFLQGSLSDGGESLHQGVFAVTPSGKFLGKIATGWPTPDAVKSLDNLKKAKRDFDRLSKSDRRGHELLEGERSLILNEDEVRPDMLKLIGSARYYDFEGMVLFDQRHPVYSKRDAVWFTQSEAKTMLPSSLKVGAEANVGEAVMKRLLLKSCFQFGCQAWWEEHIQSQNLRVKVEGVNGDLVSLLYSGTFSMDADSKWNKSSLGGVVLGKGVWDSSKEEFKSLELVSHSDVELAELRNNMHRGNTKKTKVAAFLRMAKNSQERQMIPHD